MEINREQFEAWLFSQPREREFKYISTINCLLCQFFKENTTLQNPILGSNAIYNGEGEMVGQIPSWAVMLLEQVVKSYCHGLTTDYTFGQVQDFYITLFNFETPKSQPAENLDCSHLEPIAPRTNSLLSDVNASKTTV